MAFTPNHEDWIDSNLGGLAAMAWAYYQTFGRCALVVRMPSNFGISANEPLKAVPIVAHYLGRNRVQAVVARLLRLETHVERVINVYDPEREIAFEVWYPNGRGFAWYQGVTPSPPEAFAHFDKANRDTTGRGLLSEVCTSKS
jgi:hypothetical protein